jgi:asparagine synthase (glutamine-hydrolysing)
MLSCNGFPGSTDFQLNETVALAGLRVDRLGTSNGRPAPLSGVWTGELYNRTELLQALEFSPGEAKAARMSDGEIFLRLYQAFGRSCVEKTNGQFAFAVYDQKRRELVLGRDRLGIETLYYYSDSQSFVFASRLSFILGHPNVRRELNPQALRRFLVFCYNPGWDTFFSGVKQVRPGSLVVLTPEGVTQQRYWFLSFRKSGEKSEADYCNELRELTKDSLRRRIPDSAPLGIFLSGGMDSSSVAGLTRDLVSKPFKTFSYRCLGKSVDESHYARIMAEYCRSEHHEVLYEPADVCKMAAMVELMDEPFCNVGINVATYLLGQAAQGKVARVFSGDGGDELFGGHPVYVADRVAATFEKIPFPLRSSLTAALRLLPDSDQKQNLTVKLKRFSESIAYPKELGTHRWRMYYRDDDLKKLMNADVSNGTCPSHSLFADLVDLKREADGCDMLSRSLYVDFHTELGFSLRRMDLVRHFQMTPCFPLLDHRLVEHAATIPSHLKIRNRSETKYIQHRAMEPLLPHAIVHRKDKLGHSIPFKTWLHRLWALTVLELWMTANHLQ